MTDDVIRVVLADDQAWCGRGSRRSSARPGYRRHRRGQRGREAVELVERLKPDVVVMDCRCRRWTASQRRRRSSRAVRDACAHPHHARRRGLSRAVDGGGCAGYLVKTKPTASSWTPFARVAHGDIYVQPAAARILAKKLREESGSQRARAVRKAHRSRA